MLTMRFVCVGLCVRVLIEAESREEQVNRSNVVMALRKDKEGLVESRAELTSAGHIKTSRYSAKCHDSSALARSIELQQTQPC